MRAILALSLILVSCGPPDAVRPGASRFALPSDPAACLTLEGPAFDFGELEARCVARRSALIRNVCTDAVTLRRIEVAASDFHLVQSPALPASGLALPAGEAVTVGVALWAAAQGGSTSSLVIEAAAGEVSSQATWLLTAVATAVPVISQALDFNVPERPAVDLLIVIDNATSLERQRESLERNLTSIARYLSASGTDARVAVTVVAGSSRGALLAVLDSQSPSFESDLGAIVAGMSFAPSTRDAFAVAVDALRVMPLRAQVGTNLLFISDGPELSPGPALEYLSRMETVAGEQRRLFGFGISVIGPFDVAGACIEALDDGRYRFAAQWRHGVRDSICAPDWAKTVESVEKLAFGYRASAYLSQVPSFTRGVELKVTLEGSELPRVDQRGATIWNYDWDNEAIVMEPMYSPEPGQVAVATYAAQCPALP